ncbi:MAG: TIM barrel protein [archaeon]
MAEKGGKYIIGDLYQGGYSSLKPNFGELFAGHHIPSGSIGAPTKPDTANQIQQINQLINQGIVPIEAGVLSPEVFDQIPKQHFKEMGRMAKITGTKLSVHAPLIEPSGIDPEGRRPWGSVYRELAENQLNDMVDKVHDIKSQEPIPITVHSSGLPGTEYGMGKEGKEIRRLIAINRETGKLVPLEKETMYIPGGNLEKPEIRDAKTEIKILNDSEWSNSLSQVVYYKENADRILSEIKPYFHYLKEKESRGEPIEEGVIDQEAMKRAGNADLYLRDAHKYLNSLFSKAYKYGNEEEKKKLLEVSGDFKKEMDKDSTSIGVSNALQTLIGGMSHISPEMYVPIEKFALDKSSETFANVALKAYDKYKDEAPTICVENMFPGMAFNAAIGEQDIPGVGNLILESRNKFVQKAVEKGISEGEARKQAERLIGMTLDTGHLNIAKKQGFKDKDLKKEVEEISKYIKHVHLSDNFGYSDSHLPVGMGNAPFKDILEELEKKGIKSRKIAEAGGFVQHFGTSPYPFLLEAMGSPIYSMQMAPYWNQSLGLQQGYFSGYGQMLTQGNYDSFGAGFSALPTELGGQRGGAGGSRMSGKPME